MRSDNITKSTEKHPEGRTTTVLIGIAVLQRCSWRSSTWNDVEGSGLPSTLQLHQISTSQLMLRAKTLSSGRHVFLTSNGTKKQEKVGPSLKILAWWGSSICRALKTSLEKPYSWRTPGQSLCLMGNDEKHKQRQRQRDGWWRNHWFANKWVLSLAFEQKATTTTTTTVQENSCSRSRSGGRSPNRRSAALAGQDASAPKLPVSFAPLALTTLLHTRATSERSSASRGSSFPVFSTFLGASVALQWQICVIEWWCWWCQRLECSCSFFFGDR